MKRIHFKPLSSRWLFAACALIPGLLPVAARGQETTPAPEPVAEVRIVGNKNVPTHRILAELRTRAGSMFDPRLAQEDQKRLVATRQFVDVGVERKRESHGLVVIFRVIEAAPVRQVLFEGNESIDDKALRKEIGLDVRPTSKDKTKPKDGFETGRPLDAAAAHEAARKIQQLYFKKSYPFAEVKVAEGGQSGDTRVLFRIHEGPRTFISDVNFIGNVDFPARLLATKTKTKPRRLGFFGGKYSGTDIEEDVQKLIAYYRSLGYFDAKVSREIQMSDDRETATVNFVISEGQRYSIRSVQFLGNKKLANDELVGGLKMTDGQLFNQAALQADLQKVQGKYGALGHVEAKVNGDVRFLDDPGVVDVVYEISEGEPFYVGRVLVQGNTVTRDNVIRRDIKLAPGDLLDTNKVRESERELRNTQLFQANYLAGTGPQVKISGEGPNLRDLVAEVQEGQTGRIMFGVGVNSDAGLIGNIVISEQNFDITRFPADLSDLFGGDAFRGGGQQFRLEAAPGTQVSRYLVSWRDPMIFDLPYSFGVSGHYFERFFREYDEERAGVQFTVGHEFTDQIRGAVGLRVENIDISDPDVPTPPDLLEVVGGNFLTAITTSLEHDTRDNPFIPTSGHFYEVAFQQGFGDFTFPKVTLEGRHFWTMTERVDGSGKQVLSLRGTVGFAGEDTPLFERFYAGGFRNFRGFRFRGVGPDQLGVNVGGEFMALGSLEYQIPITADDALQMVVFSDFGTIEEDVEITDFRITAGVGLRIVIPMLGPAPLAFDFAFPIHSAETDDEQVFSFFIGFFRN